MYEVRNKLDDNTYAIKKISLSPKHVKQNFDKLLEKIIREVKFLARISHPNIIRYYNSWIELKPAINQAIEDQALTADELRMESQESKADSDNKENSIEIFWETMNEEKIAENFDKLKAQKKKYAKSFNLSEKEEDLCSELTIFIQMEPCDETLEELIIRRNTNLDALKRVSSEKYNEERKKCMKEAMMILRQIIIGLQCIHNHCYTVHRDLKPSNIFLSKKLEVKLGDFSLAKPLQAYTMKTNETLSALIPSSTTKDEEHYKINEKCIYSSPEQIKTKGTFDKRVDIYSLGVIALRLFHPTTTVMETYDVIKEIKNKKFLADEKKELYEIIRKC